LGVIPKLMIVYWGSGKHQTDAEGSGSGIVGRERRTTYHRIFWNWPRIGTRPFASGCTPSVHHPHTSTVGPGDLLRARENATPADATRTSRRERRRIPHCRPRIQVLPKTYDAATSVEFGTIGVYDRYHQHSNGEEDSHTGDSLVVQIADCWNTK